MRTSFLCIRHNRSIVHLTQGKYVVGRKPAARFDRKVYLDGEILTSGVGRTPDEATPALLANVARKDRRLAEVLRDVLG